MRRQGVLHAAVDSLVVEGAPEAAGSGACQETVTRILAFDVNETLLDLSSLDQLFEQTFGDRRVRQEWFSTVLLYSQVATIAGVYVDFSALGRVAFDMIATSHGIRLPDEARERLRRGMLTLRPRADVRVSLERLRAAGFRLMTLTKSAPSAVKAQLANAGLDGYFERTFSVDTVQRFKPAPEVYGLVARELVV
jgi:2-haloacid dehalogenase